MWMLRDAAAVSLCLMLHFTSAIRLSSRLGVTSKASNVEGKRMNLTASRRRKKEIYHYTEVVRTSTGPVRGLILLVDGPPQDQTNVYYGIPFAAPPVGDNRFRAPQPVLPWSDVRTVYRRSQPCPNNLGRGQWDLEDLFWSAHLAKVGLGSGTPQYGSEDCLYLDLYVPREDIERGPVPVVVHHFAGSFINNDNWGNGVYDGLGWTNFNSVILVNANFRVGTLGHWASEATKAESGTSGNWGLLDQRKTLQWIQTNIANFGGDPGRVTILGFSSGSFSANWHRFSPGSAGLFHSIVAEGMAPLNDWFYQPWDEATSFYSTLAEMIGCAGPSELACLRRKSVMELGSLMERNIKRLNVASIGINFVKSFFSKRGLNVNPSSKPDEGKGPILASPGWPLMGHGPVVDGTDLGLPDSPSKLLDRGIINNVSVLSTFAPNEGSFFTVALGQNHPFVKTAWPLSDPTAEALTTWGLSGSRHFPSSDVNVSQRALELYPRVAGHSGSTRFDHIVTDSSFHCPNIRVARRLAELGMKNQYLSEWKYIVKRWPMRHFMKTAHCYDVSFYFSIPGGGQRPVWPGETLAWGKREQRMAAQLQCRMAQMFHCGNPNECPSNLKSCQYALLDPKSDIGVEAPPYQMDNPGRLVVDKKTVWEPFPKDLLEKCKFWDHVTFGFVNSTYTSV